MAEQPGPSERDPLLPRPIQERPRSNRIAYLDNLRVFLTVLVIYHHAATFHYMSPDIMALPGPGERSKPTVYSFRSFIPALGSQDVMIATADENCPPGCTPLAKRPNPFLFFMTINESFFMQTFFFLAGYFSIGALKRKKSIRVFLKDKFIRLGIPLVLFLAFAVPITDQLMHPGDSLLKKLKFYYTKMLIQKGAAVMTQIWFVQVLLEFDLVLALWYALTRIRSRSVSEPGAGTAEGSPWSRKRFILTAIFVFTFLLPACYLARAYLPLVPFVFAIIGFPPQLPQFILCYISGMHLPALLPHLTSRHHVWRRLFVSYIISVGGLWLLYLQYGWTVVNPFVIGPGVKTLLFEVWAEASLVLLSTAWLSLFHYYKDHSFPSIGKKLGAFLSPRYAYTVYLIHLMPLEVGLFYLGPCQHGIGLCILRATLIGTVTVIASWIVARGVVKIPGVGRVL